MFDLSWYILFSAFILDVALGDPRNLPHPVVYMGKAISFCEPVFRKIWRNLLISGTGFAVFLIGLTWVAGETLVWLSFVIHPVFSDLVQTVMLFYCFSSRSLEKAAMAVFKALDENDLPKARKKVAMIVGRETQNLDETAVVRAGVETVAENFVDGFLSPLFFALVGGAPLALAYKMVNTLDSMVGYKNEPYLLFGRAAARIDDAANFIPARLSVPVIFSATGLFSLKRGIQALKTAVKEGRSHKSPNAGFPEAAFAGALAVRLGGPNVYHGRCVEKPFIGKAFADPVKQKIKQACDLMMLSALMAVLISCFTLFILSRV